MPDTAPQPPVDEFISEGDAAAPAGTGLTRRQAMRLGARTYFLTQTAVLLASFVIHVAVRGAQYTPAAYLEAFLIAGFITLPPLTALGAWIAPTVYSLLNDERKFHPISYGTWLAMSLLLSPAFIGFTLCYRARESVMVNRKTPELAWWSVFFILCFIVQVLSSLFGSNIIHVPLALSALYGVFLADTLTVRIMATRYFAGDWAGEKKKKFQYTLGALMGAVLGGAAYVTGLILIFRP